MPPMSKMLTPISEVSYGKTRKVSKWWNGEALKYAHGIGSALNLIVTIQVMITVFTYGFTRKLCKRQKRWIRWYIYMLPLYILIHNDVEMTAVVVRECKARLRPCKVTIVKITVPAIYLTASELCKCVYKWKSYLMQNQAENQKTRRIYQNID